MDWQALRLELAQFEADGSLVEEANVEGRTRALDFLAFVDETIRAWGGRPVFDDLSRRSDALRARLIATNSRLFDRVRSALWSGALRGEALRRELNRYTNYAPDQGGSLHLGYDGLDTLVWAVLQLDRQDGSVECPEPEMVHYEPTPARVILDLIDHVGVTPGDVFYDFGSGLGLVAILVHLLVGITTKGIEIQTSLCSSAQRTARELGLADVHFVNGDVRDVDFSDGTVFYLFTPFRGKMLRQVFDQLGQLAKRRSVRVCTFGPCTRQALGQPWLEAYDPGSAHDFKLATFQSR